MVEKKNNAVGISTDIDFLIKGVDANELVRACGDAKPEPDLTNFLARINKPVNSLQFRHVLSRSGWHRPGGIVTLDGRYVCRNIRTWVEQESAGEVSTIYEKYADESWLATRLLGMTHYFVVATGQAAADFIQLEIEELQEVLTRPLFDSDWYPESLEEFIEPYDFTEMEPEPVTNARYLFRRVMPVAQTLEELTAEGMGSQTMKRFMHDWDSSTASMNTAFWKRWVIRFIPYTDRYGDKKLILKPLTTYQDLVPDVNKDMIQRGAGLANLIRDIDRQAGYPMAWYFFLLTTPEIKHEIAWSVRDDHSDGYEYLPDRDLEVIRAWCDDPYSI